MKPPCEIVVWYVIPAIRSELAKDLLALGMKQKDVSELMDITQPAVSQYITDKRGSGVVLSSNVKEMVNELHNGEAKKTEIIGRTCSICKHIEIGDVLKQLNIDKNDLDEDCQGCLGSEVTECKS